MADTSQLPEYLQSSSSLIKALKAARDPPQSGWPLKIEIARQANESEGFFLYRKRSLLRDWVIEEFVKIRGAKLTSFNPLLDYRYHELLESLSHATDATPQTIIPVQTILHTFFSTLCAHVRKVESAGKLLGAAAKNFLTLLSSVREDQSSTAGKAEGWLDVLGLMLTWIDKDNMEDCLDPVERLLRAVGTELVVSLDVAQNRKKITTSIQPLAPALLSAWQSYPSIRAAIESPFKALVLPLPVLQQEDASTAYLLPSILYHRDILPSTKLSFLPRYLALLIGSIHQNRYALFPPTASARSSVPLDVHISGRVRQAVLQCTRFVLESISKVSSPTSDREARCEAVARVWQAVQEWGGYLEGDAAWSSLLQETISDVGKDLDDADAALAGAIYQVLETAASLDYGATQLNAKEESHIQTCSRNVLAHAISNSATNNAERALGLLLTVTIYHGLTHETSGLLEILCDAIKLALSHDDGKSTYQNICRGPLVTAQFRQKLERNIADTLVGGGSAGGGWTTKLDSISERLERCYKSSEPNQDTQEGPSKRRRANDGSVVASSSVDRTAAEFGVLSRLVAVLLDTVVDVQVEKVATFRKTVEVHYLAWQDMASAVSLGSKRSTWADQVRAAALTRLMTSGARFVETSAKPDLLASHSGLDIKGEAAGELSYETYLAAFESAEKLGMFPQSDDFPMKTFLPSPDGANLIWSGLVGDLHDEALSAAIWQTVAMGGVPVIEAYASDQQVDVLAQSIVHRGAEATRLASHGFSAVSAIERVMCSSELWESPRLQVAICRHVRELMQMDVPEPSTVRDIFTFLTLTPVEYLSRNLRNLTITKAYEWDVSFARCPERWQESVLLRQYLSRTIAETGYIGNLETESIDVMLRPLPESTTQTVDVTQALLSGILSALLREPKVEKHSSLLAYLGVKLVNDIGRHQRLGPICAILLTTPNELDISTEALPSHVLGSLDELHRKMGRIYDKQFKTSDVTDELLQLYRALVVYSSWRRSDTVSVPASGKGLAERALRSCLTKLSVRDSGSSSQVVARAIPALDTLAMEIGPRERNEMGMQTWLAGWIAVKAADAHSLDTYGQGLMDRLFKRSLANITSATYGSLLASLMDTLFDPARLARNVAIATLSACLLLLELQINSSGKIFKQHLSRLLALLHACISENLETDVTVCALQIMEMISERKPVSLSEQDASEIVLASFAALSPSTTKDAQTNIEIPTLVLSICNSLVRHRRDLTLNILPQLMRIYSRMFALFALPRASIGSGKLRNIVINRRPKWMGSQDNECLGEQEASTFARAMGTLTGKSTIRRGKTAGETTPGQHLDRDLGSLTGQLSKHAPGVLVAYVRAVADPLSGLPQAVRGELEPGLYALCEAITAGGKAQYGKGPGEGVGEAFGLGEGDNADTEYEVWVDLWQRWTTKRYAGQG